ncbi:ABC transporter ATP-binding protein [Paraburkholderia gardini]|uniref:ABC transporter ATP-binding protein n=1 Tax=Paraburkholderia gardini TaxID=2823469 RepID=UPI001D3B769A|nr:ABC transporter ATP-binding protein [Paraburkholderia gardini]CAG4904775.1 Vitamin B12 import ATP-binding protein BtuD [Paraburkholderia gardini]
MFSEDIAIQVDNLGKCYEIYERPQDRLRQSIMPKLHALVGRAPKAYYREFWALKDVSFEVGRGETIGIIGRNGSGKSTLLQIICGTLAPTTGRVETRGRVAALLELGAGFNPEFTGRENVYMNATVLGLQHEEIDARFDDIAAFADIGDFIEQPVKHYSSGMYARLAFAVAISVDPDILVVDEALSVGDEPFQRKCFARINKIKSDGGTILFVSHSGGTIINLCDRAILLNRGERLFTGVPKRAVFFSQKLGNLPTPATTHLIEEIRREDVDGYTLLPNKPESAITDANIDVRSKTADHEIKPFLDASFVSETFSAYKAVGARIEQPSLCTSSGEKVNHILQGGNYKLTCTAHFEEDCYGVRFFALIRTTAGVDLAGCAHPLQGEPGIDVAAGTILNLDFEFTCLLTPATYFCNFAIQGIDGSLHHRIVDAIVFRVIPDEPSAATALVDLGFQLRTIQL